MRPMHLAESPAGHATLLAARQALIQEQTSAGHWEGQLSSSALSTATAVVTLALSLREPPSDSFGDGDRVQRGTGWLLDHQNEDGGWGDTDRSFSNISTTALGWAALAFAARSELVATAERRAEAWLTNAAGGVAPSALAKSIEARYGKDRTFSVPILTMCALAGRMGPGSEAWRLIPQLPFELAVIPRKFFTVITLPVVSYALPALIAMGLVRHRHRPSRNPIARLIRDAAASRSLGVLDSLQPPDGGFLEAAPLATTPREPFSLFATSTPMTKLVRQPRAALSGCSTCKTATEASRPSVAAGARSRSTAAAPISLRMPCAHGWRGVPISAPPFRPASTGRSTARSPTLRARSAWTARSFRCGSGTSMCPARKTRHTARAGSSWLFRPHMGGLHETW